MKKAMHLQLTRLGSKAKMLPSFSGAGSWRELDCLEDTEVTSGNVMLNLGQFNVDTGNGEGPDTEPLLFAAASASVNGLCPNDDNDEGT